MSTKTTSPYATPKEVADYFKVSLPTALDWYHKGIIPAVIAEGRVYRFDLAAVEAALREREKSNKPK